MQKGLDKKHYLYYNKDRFGKRGTLMKVVTLIDSFKGSITSMEAGEAAARGVRAVYPDAKVDVLPLADGGEGTVQALVTGCRGDLIRTEVTGPLGAHVLAEYGIIFGDTAVIEMSAAAGITLVPPEQRDPMKTTTYGVGELIKDAISRGVRRFIIGIGGSATNDGGAGMLQALGFDLLDETGAPVEKGARGLEKLHTVCAKNANSLLSACEFRIACDVENPLCGALGCSAIYGPQKGATKDDIPQMDAWLAHYAQLAKTVNPAADPNLPGAGAAGGMGFAFSAFLGGKLQSGISLVLDAIRAEEYVRSADVVLTGEGRLDGQSAMGKAPVGVAKLAKKHGKPVIVFAGCVTEEASACNTQGIDAFFPILRGVVTLDEAMNTENAKHNLEKTAEQAFRLVRTFRK